MLLLEGNYVALCAVVGVGVGVDDSFSVLILGDGRRPLSPSATAT
jgi:hypothetical protein